MALIPGRLVTAPEPLRRRYGLFTAASGPVDLPSPHGQGGGVRYVPVTCGQAHPYPINCYDGLVEVPEEGKPRDPDNTLVEARPFMVVASIECGSVGYTSAEDEARVRRRLEAGEQGGAEFAFWTGLDRNGNDLDIVSLAGSAEDITVADELDIIEVVAALEDYAYRAQDYGYAAFLHAPVSVTAHAAESNLIVQDGPLMRTPYGSVWVFGGGYPGSGQGATEPPDGGTFIHVTGQVTVWRAESEHVFPVDQTMDRSTNQRLLVAEREYAIGYDCLNGRAAYDPLGGVS